MPSKHQKFGIKYLNIDGYRIEVSLKPIRYMYLKCSRKNGNIRVSAPLKMPDSVIELFVRSKSKWIDKHICNPVPEISQAFYGNGEMTSLFGAQIPIVHDYANKNIKAYLHNNAILMRIKPSYTQNQRDKVLIKFLRNELQILSEQLVHKWESMMQVQVYEVRIKNMKTRWGTCNIRDRRIWLNLQLVKYKPELIELVVVHEMVHLLERLHNHRFYSLMDKFLPDWRKRNEELNEVIR